MNALRRTLLVGIGTLDGTAGCLDSESHVVRVDTSRDGTITTDVLRFEAAW